MSVLLHRSGSIGGGHDFGEIIADQALGIFLVARR